MSHGLLLAFEVTILVLAIFLERFSGLFQVTKFKEL